MGLHTVGLSFPTLQLQHPAAVAGHHVESATEPQCGTDEGGFEQSVGRTDANIIGPETLADRLADIIEVPPCLIKECGIYILGC